MKKIISLALAIFVCAVTFAQKATKDYQRPSLHMVLMTSSAEAAAGTVAITDPEIIGYMAGAWQTYPFPALYNDFKIGLSQVEVGSAKGSIMDILAMYNDPKSLENLDAAALQKLLEMMKGKEYLESLKAEVDKSADEIAHQLVKKWWCIQDDGSVSDTLLFRLACYSATQNQAADASQTTMGAQRELFNQLATATMANTYVTCTKVDFYENEPIAAFIRNVMVLAASYAGPAASLGAMAAEKTYEATKEGYTAFANALLYKLDWTDEIANEFYNIWTDGSHVDIAKFNAMKFTISYAGATKASATCMMKKSDRGKGAEHMVWKTIYKALDKQFVDLQEAYEEFRPMVPVLGLDAKGGIIADMGTKEGVAVGDQFNLLYPEVDQNGVLKYKNKGAVKVVKWTGDQFPNGVWDNQNIDNAASADLNGASVEVIGTHLSKFKGATPSMFVKKTKKK